MAATVIAAKAKAVADGRFNMDLYPATGGFPVTFAHGEGKDFPEGQAGDQMVALVFSRVTVSRITMPDGQDWQAYHQGAKTSEPPALGSSGVTFDESVDLFVRKGTGISVFAFARDYTPGETWKFASIRSDTGVGGQLIVVMMLVRGTSNSNPFVTLTYQYTAIGSDTYNASGVTGQVANTAAVRVLWANISTPAAETVEFQGGDRWSDVPGVPVVGSAFGARSSNILVAGHTGTSDGGGSFPSEAVSFSPSAFSGVDAMTFLLAPSAPTNLFNAPPGVSGTVQGGKTLTATPGAWVGSGTLSYAYQWQSQTGAADPVDIVGETGSTLAVTEGMVGKRLRVKVTATGDDGSVIAFSTLTTIVVTGLSPAPSGNPEIAGNALAGLTLPGELLTADLSDVSWTLSPPLVTEWGRSSDASMIGAAVVSTGGTRTSSSADIGLWLSVRQRDATTGVATGWATPVRGARAYTQGDREYRFAAPNEDGDFVPGANLVGTDGAFTPLHVSQAANGDYEDYSVTFVVNTHDDIAAAFEAYIVEAPVNPAVTVEFAALAVDPSTPVPAFTSESSPAIVGGWVQPTVDDPLVLGAIAAQGGYVGVARRRTVAQGAARYREDKLVWEVGEGVPVVE